MTNRDLLKEAIADAKAIKDTAIANAKSALEESFTPHLKSMLAAKINEMDNFYEEDDTMEEVETDLNEMEDQDEMDEAKKKTYSEATEEMDEEMDLDELLAELELEETVTEAKEEIEAEETEEEGEEEGEEEEIDLENMSEEDLKNFIENVIEDMITDGEIEAGHESMEGEEEEEESEEEINIDEILAELKSEKVEEEMSAMMGMSAGAGLAELAKMFKKGLISLNDFLEKVAAASAPGFSKGMNEEEKMKAELEEAMDAIKTLRSELNEINLLNAKLLYTNKIFKSKNLTETQKVKVLTAFDKATSKKEAQLVYETLLGGLKSETKSPIKESLGRASKSAGVSVKKPIVESNEMINRFQKLAGII